MKFTSIFDVVFLLKVQVIKTSDIFECVKLLNTGKERVSARCDGTEVMTKTGHANLYWGATHFVLIHFVQLMFGFKNSKYSQMTWIPEGRVFLFLRFALSSCTM